MKRFDFSGKRVLITGASAGIGRALSAQFARRGAILALGSLPSEAGELESWARELRRTHGTEVHTFPVDLLEEGGPERLHHEVSLRFGKVYALVNNAGTVAYGEFHETDWGRQEATLRLNLLVPMRLMHLFLGDMVRSGEGVVFNVSSVSALQPTPFQAVYGASKAGLQSLSQAVRAELAGSGVTVCTLNPPYIDTRLLRTPGYPEDLRFFKISGKKSPEWLAERAIRAFEEGRMMFIPGLANRIIHDLLVRVSPRGVVDAVSRFFLQGASRAAAKKRAGRGRGTEGTNR
ncbi:MAG TPA: SDR family NAD(P)-dependent oxidoreductase [Deltaproteobacteria bacterium]|nr:SDR family NAD(P)-dependent oxidoreductase [Deltaproteobacteria bacterium]HOM28771.1 SDR family NAD(P)-dependent oxidoreductase [Deltaproteobacteria bacterium]HPP80573.1 SDR family NAD(P)-dependent oxidoreductase [Deltaproteobacteria bacterium]